MRRAGATALLAALVLTLLAARPAGAADDPPHADDRLDRVTAALAQSPLFVDPDVSIALDGSERGRVRRAIGETAGQLGVPAYVVVIPNKTDSESQGRNEAFLFGLHETSGRDGLYVMVDSRGRMETEAFRVPRRYDHPPLDENDPADRDRPFDGLADRIVQRLNGYAAAPSASPRMPSLRFAPESFGEEHDFAERDPEIQAPLVTGLVIAGPVAAALLYWAGLGVLVLLGRGDSARVRTKVPRHDWIRTKPSTRRLRRLGARELDRLRRLLITTEAERGRRFAVSAYDAAQILYDDAKENEHRAIDLVGAIVLARQGRIALTRDIDSPPVPCLMNPLHGESTVRRRLPRFRDDDALPKSFPLCETCRRWDERHGLTERHLLKIPGPDGRRPHTQIPGVWRDAAWGARGKNILPRVMRYLGVD